MYADKKKCRQECNTLDHVSIVAFSDKQLLDDFVQSRKDLSDIYYRIFEVKDSTANLNTSGETDSAQETNSSEWETEEDISEQKEK